MRGASFLIPGPNDQPRAEGTVGDYVTKLARMPLLVDPGAQWIYGPSTDVVGYLCEVFSGQPLDQFLQQRIFKPLEMFDTAFWVHASKVHRLAANYRRDGIADTFSLFDAPATSTFARPKTYFSGVGGLTSTAFDYMRFAKMLANGGELRGRRIIGPRTLRLMAMNHLPGNRDIASMALSGGPAPKGDGFGLGFAVLIDPTLSQTLGTPGEFSGPAPPPPSSSSPPGRRPRRHLHDPAHDGRGVRLPPPAPRGHLPGSVGLANHRGGRRRGARPAVRGCP